MTAINKLSFSNVIIFKLWIIMILAPLLLGCKSSDNGIDFTPEPQVSNNQSLTKKERELQHVEHEIAAAYTRLNAIDEQMHHKQSQLEILDQLAQQQHVHLNLKSMALDRLNVDLQQKEESLLACSDQLEDTHNQLSTQQTNLRAQQQNLDNNTTQIEQKQQTLQAIIAQIDSKQSLLEDKVNQLNQYALNLANVMLEIDTKQQSLQTIVDQIRLKQQELRQKNNQLIQRQASLANIIREIDTKQQTLHRVNDELNSKQHELSSVNDNIHSQSQLLIQRTELLSEYDSSIALKHNRLDELDNQTTVKRNEILEMDRQLQRKQEQLLQQSQLLFVPNDQTIDQAMIENINIKELADKILRMIELYFQLSSLENSQSQERLPITHLSEHFVTETPSQLNDLRTKIIDELKVFYQYIQQNHNSASDPIEYIDNLSSPNSSFASDLNTQVSYVDEREFQQQIQVEMTDVQVQTTDDYIIELNNKLNMLAFEKSIYIQKQQQISGENEKLKQENREYKHLNNELMAHVANLSINLSDNEQMAEMNHHQLENVRNNYTELQHSYEKVVEFNKIIQEKLETVLAKNHQFESDIASLKNELSMTKQVYQDELQAFAYKEIEYRDNIEQLLQQSPQQLMTLNSDIKSSGDSIFNSCYQKTPVRIHNKNVYSTLSKRDGLSSVVRRLDYT